MGCRPGSSIDLSAPTIMLPQVQVTSTPFSLSSFIVKFVLYLSREKKKNKQKEAGFGSFKKRQGTSKLAL